jgi:hypothetical protein
LLRGDQMFALFPRPGSDLWRVLTPEPDDAGDADQFAVILFAEHTGFPAAAITACE